MKNFTYSCRKNIFTFISLLSFCIGSSQSPSANEVYIKVTEFLSEDGQNGNKIQSVIYYDGIGRKTQQILINGTPDNKDIVVHHDFDAITGRELKNYLPAPANQSGGVFIADAEQLASNFYYNQFNESVYFSEKKLDAQSLGSTLLQQAFPGNDWAIDNGHTIKYKYLINSPNEVRRFSANSNWNSSEGVYTNSIQDMGYYPSGDLFKQIIQDEQNTSDTNAHSTELYKDRMGKTILKRTYSTVGSNTGIKPYDTYFVYDIYDNLVYIIPPMVKTEDGISEDEEQLITHYIYDDKFRIVEKELPDRGKEYIVYDKQDRIVATKNSSNPWLFTKYDKFGRAVYTGIIGGNSTRKTLQLQANSALNNNNEQRNAPGFTKNGLTVSYTSNAFPASFSELLTVFYYDDYTFNGAVSVPTSVEGQEIIKHTPSVTTNNVTTKGSPVATMVRVLESNSWEKNYVFYNKEVEEVRLHKINHLNGYTKIDSKLDFRNKPLYSKTYHKRTASDTELLIRDDFEYDHLERLLSHKQRIGSLSEQLISRNYYNSLGQIIIKKIGGTDLSGGNRLQQVDFKYNIRGWLTDINNIENQITGKPDPNGFDDLFAFRINYNKYSYDGSAVGAELQYNGNISQTLWRTSTDNTIRGYVYEYDEINRLKNAFYHKPNSGASFPGNYDEKLTYDKNGNILSLKRYAGYDFPDPAEMVDDLNYIYGQDHQQGGQYYQNRLTTITDDAGSPKGFNNGNSGTGIDYTFDSGGNITSDKNKGITNITYNHLNLPVEIVWTSSKKIQFIYNAAGQKLQKKQINGSAVLTTDYIDGFQYYNNVLQFFPTPEGYVKNTVLNGQNTYDYVYNYTDHLGNIRVSYTKDPQTDELKILQENHYYPFGLMHQKYSAPTGRIEAINNETDKAVNPENPLDVISLHARYDYKYNYREWQDDNNLDWYAMDFRNYDPAVGRFHNPDLLSEVSPDWSPYRFAFNNPVAFNDPTGLWEGDIEIDLFFDESSNYIHFEFLGWDIFLNLPVGAEDPEGGDVNYGGEENVTDTERDFDNGDDCCPGQTNDRPFGRPDYGTEFRSNEIEYVNFTYKPKVIALGEGGLLEYIGGSGFIKGGGKVVGYISKLWKERNAAKAVKALPSLDATGKVHGTLPKVQDFGKYSKDELRILLKELKQSVQKRIEVTSKMGRDRGHGQRQGAEQDLIKSLEKYLGQ